MNWGVVAAFVFLLAFWAISLRAVMAGSLLLGAVCLVLLFALGLVWLFMQVESERRKR